MKQSKIKVLFDHQTFCIQKYGGISRYFYELANHLGKMDLASVKVFVPLYINEYFDENSEIRPVGIRLPRSLPQKVSRRISALTDVLALNLFYKHKCGADIFHETYYSLVDSCPVGAKRVITVCDMIHEKFPDNFPVLDRTREIKARAIRRADHIICISENTRKDLIELLGVAEERVSVVYLGHSFMRDAGVYGQPKTNKPYLLYVGKRGGYKNFSGFLAAYASSTLLKNEFSIVCFGGGNFTAAETALMKSLEIEPENVIYKSGGDDVLAGCYQSAAVFVYPSLYEGFGIPPLEAMSCGCPVACSNTSSMPEVVGNAAELFEPADAADMRLAIERVVSSSEHAALLIKNAAQRLEQFSWQKCARDTVDVYSRILNE